MTDDGDPTTTSNKLGRDANEPALLYGLGRTRRRVPSPRIPCPVIRRMIWLIWHCNKRAAVYPKNPIPRAPCNLQPWHKRRFEQEKCCRVVYFRQCMSRRITRLKRAFAGRFRLTHERRIWVGGLGTRSSGLCTQTRAEGLVLACISGMNETKIMRHIRTRQPNLSQ